MCVTKFDVVLPLADIEIEQYLHFALHVPSFSSSRTVVFNLFGGVEFQ